MRTSKTILGVAFLTGCLAAYTVPVKAPAALGQPQRTSGPEHPKNGRFGDPTVFGMNYQDYFYGVAAKVQQDALVLNKTKVGVPQTIELTKKTKYIRDGKRSTLDQLKIGDMVYVDLKTNKKTGAMVARKIVSGVGATAAP